MCPIAGPGSPTASKNSWPQSKNRCGLYLAEVENFFFIDPKSVAFFISDEAAFLTGCALDVDGGAHLGHMPALSTKSL